MRFSYAALALLHVMGCVRVSDGLSMRRVAVQMLMWCHASACANKLKRGQAAAAVQLEAALTMKRMMQVELSVDCGSGSRTYCGACGAVHMVQYI